MVTVAYDAQTRLRIRLAVAAWAYEVYNVSIMSDAEYDALSKEVDVSINTGNAVMDSFFRQHFDASTGLLSILLCQRIIGNE